MKELFEFILIIFSLFGAFCAGGMILNSEVMDELEDVRDECRFNESEYNKLQSKLLNQKLENRDLELLVFNQSLMYERQIYQLVLDYEMKLK